MERIPSLISGKWEPPPAREASARSPCSIAYYLPAPDMSRKTSINTNGNSKRNKYKRKMKPTQRQTTNNNEDRTEARNADHYRTANEHDDKRTDEIASNSDNSDTTSPTNETEGNDNVVEGTDEVTVSYVCKCHACGRFYELKEYQSVHLNQCAPNAKFVKVNCVCGVIIKVDKHTFIGNILCSHIHLIKDETVPLNFRADVNSNSERNEAVDLTAENVDEQIPTENVDLPTRNADLSTENVDLPMKNDDLPTENVNLPIKIDDLPTENIDLPVKNSDLPTENVNLPIKIDDLPTENIDLPVKNSDLPTENVNLPIKIDDLPTENVNLPMKFDDLPTENVNLPTENVDIPTVNGILPSSDPLLDHEVTAAVTSNLQTESIETTEIVNVDESVLNVDRETYNSETVEEIRIELNDDDEPSKVDEDTYWVSHKGTVDQEHHNNSETENSEATSENNDVIPDDDAIDEDNTTNEETGQNNDNEETHDQGEDKHLRDSKSPEIIEVVFHDICAMFRFNFLDRAWMPRGTGNIFILYMPEKNTYILDFRRLVAPGVNRIALMMSVHTGLQLQRMKYNDRGWEFTYHYLTADGTGEFQNIGIRFRSQELADKFGRTFNKIKEQLLEIASPRELKRNQGATRCPAWPATRTTRSSASSPYSEVSLSFNASPTFGASPTPSAMSPTSSSMLPTSSAMSLTSSVVPTLRAPLLEVAEACTALQTSPDDGALTGALDLNVNTSMSSTSRVSETLRNASDNEEVERNNQEICQSQIVQELIENKIMLNELLIITKRIDGKVNIQDGTSNEREESHWTIVKECPLCNASLDEPKKHYLTDILEMIVKAISSYIQDCDQNNEGNRASSTANAEVNEIVEKTSKSADDANGQSPEENEKARDHVIPSEINGNADLTSECNGEISANSDVSEPDTKTVSKDDRSDVASPVEEETPPNKNIAVEIKQRSDSENDAVDSDKRNEYIPNNNEESDETLDRNSAEVFVENKLESDDTIQDVTLTTTLIKQDPEQPVDGSTTTKDNTNKEDHTEDEINRNQEATKNAAEERFNRTEPILDSIIPMECSSLHAVSKNCPKLLKPDGSIEDNVPPEEVCRSSEDGTVETEKESKTVIKEKNGKPKKINSNIIKLPCRRLAVGTIRICCRLILYTIGLAIVAVITIFMIYFFEPFVFSIRCLE